MTRKIETVPVAALVEDMSLYPRHAVDDTNVQALSLALEAGCDLPPLIADAATKKIVDGWHRGRAYVRCHGPGAVAPVEFRSYPNEAAMVEAAVALNSSHGRRLDAIDQTRAVLMMERHGIQPKRIAMALHVPEARVVKLQMRVAQARVETDTTVPGTNRITLKRPVRHLQDKVLTKEQAIAHDMMPGTSFLLLARQLTAALNTGLVNKEDDKLRDGLTELRKSLATAGY